MTEVFTIVACEKIYGMSCTGSVPALSRPEMSLFPSSLQPQNQVVSPGGCKPLPLCAQGREVETAVLPRVMERTGEQHGNSKTGLNLSIFPRFYKERSFKYIVRLSQTSAGVGLGPYFPSFLSFSNPVIFIRKRFNQNTEV